MSPRETTPVGTPKGVTSRYSRKSEREKDLLFSWYRKTPDNFGGQGGLYVDSTLLESGLEDSTFPLFGLSPPRDKMIDVGSIPISIATQVGDGPVSPRQQTSNLTSALQSSTGNEVRPSPLINVGGGNSKGGRHDSLGVSISGLTPQYGGSGAQPISMTGSSRSRQRRESIAGSMAGGMSWGGVSVGSWIRDEYASPVVALCFPFCIDQVNLIGFIEAFDALQLLTFAKYHDAGHITISIPISIVSFVFIPAKDGSQLHEGLLMLRQDTTHST